MCGSRMILTLWVNDFVLTNQTLQIFLFLIVAIYVILFFLSLFGDQGYHRYIVAAIRVTNIIFYLYLLNYVFQVCF